MTEYFLSEIADEDLSAIVKASEYPTSGERYKKHLMQAVKAVTEDPRLYSSKKTRSHMHIYYYHMRYCHIADGVKNPRHSVVFRRIKNDVHVLGFVHDAMDQEMALDRMLR